MPIAQNDIHNFEYTGVNNAWEGQDCFLIGCGKSLEPIFNQVGLDWIEGKHSIGMNHIIEDYDKFEWFCFLDQLFLNRTPYNINKFKGKIFAKYDVQLKHGGNINLFRTHSRKVMLKIEDGLYHPHLTGLIALSLAIVSGANPIYLLGYGNGVNFNKDNYHYKKNYTGEERTGSVFTKMTNAAALYYKSYEQFKNKIIHVTDGIDIPIFQKMSTKDFMEKFCKPKDKIKIEGRQPVICHLGFGTDINKYSEQTRHCFNKGYGKHIISNVNSESIPDADFYIYEHFASTRDKEKEFPYKHKAIDIVHTCRCVPTGDWHRIVALTNYWKLWLSRKNIPDKKIEVIHAGINLDEYKDVKIDYTKKVFGRICQYSTAKINALWNDTVKSILETIPESKCILYTKLENIEGRPLLKHDRMEYNETVNRADFKGDPLKRLCLYVHANGCFKEICSLAIIEAMACGLPIIYLFEDSMSEQIGNAGIACQNMEELKTKVIELLNNPEQLEYWGKLSKERSKEFHVNKFVKGIDKIVKEYLNV